MPTNYPLAVLIIVAVYVLQVAIQSLVHLLNNSVESFIKSQEDKEGNIKDIEFKKEADGFKLFQVKKIHLGYITKIIGYFESFFFIIVTAVILFNGLGVEMLPTIAGGWIALKIFGNFQQWSGVVLGRATFYIFLIGSLVNIILSAGLGILYFFYA